MVSSSRFDFVLFIFSLKNVISLCFHLFCHFTDKFCMKISVLIHSFNISVAEGVKKRKVYSITLHFLLSLYFKRSNNGEKINRFSIFHTFSFSLIVRQCSILFNHLWTVACGLTHNYLRDKTIGAVLHNSFFKYHRIQCDLLFLTLQNVIIGDGKNEMK